MTDASTPTPGADTSPPNGSSPEPGSSPATGSCPATSVSSAREPRLPRGISPRLLLDAVRNTIPFLFDPPADEPLPDLSRAPHLQRLRAMAQRLVTDPEPELSHHDYYMLCLSAHHATVSSLVPTDVDNQIRLKLWPPALPIEGVLALTDELLLSRAWDPRAVSHRHVTGPQSGRLLCGHSGEWLSTAGAAYACLRSRQHPAAQRVADAIWEELNTEAEIFRELQRARDGIGVLKAATIIAHNAGDLDRVLDMWEVPAKDPFRLKVYRSGLDDASRFEGSLVLAGALNKAYIAVENHRHFVLREPRCLRRRARFLVPLGPFLDEWGQTVGASPHLEPEEKAEIIRWLVEGYERLNPSKPGPDKSVGPVGYARALAGMLECLPGGMNALEDLLPSRVFKALKAGPLHQKIAVPRRRFEEQWRALGLAPPPASAFESAPKPKAVAGDERRDLSKPPRGDSGRNDNPRGGSRRGR